MFNRLLLGAAALSLAASMAFGAQGAKFYIGDGDKEKAYMDMVNNKITTIGFVLSDPHERIKDADVRAKFIATFPELDAMIEKEIGSKVQIVEYSALPAKPMMTFELTFERGASLDAFIADFQGKFEEVFEANQYIIAGYKDIKGSMNDANI